MLILSRSISAMVFSTDFLASASAKVQSFPASLKPELRLKGGELAFVSDCELLQAELLVRNRVFHKVLLAERHVVPHVIAQILHHISGSRGSSPARAGQILLPRAHVRAAVLHHVTAKTQNPIERRYGDAWVYASAGLKGAHLLGFCNGIFKKKLLDWKSSA